jgi:hypothetical protein
VTLQALLHCAAEIREAVAMQPIWAPHCDTLDAPHRSSLGELDWREEMRKRQAAKIAKGGDAGN